MLVVQLSNMFNLIALNSGLFRFYHYGWPNDMNINIQNNSDPNASTGNKFPYLLFIPPVVTGTNEDSSNYETYACELILTDTYGYQQQQLGYKSDTSVEIESQLQSLATQFMNYVRQYAVQSGFDIQNYTVDLDPYRFTANTRSVRLRFNLIFPTECVDDDVNLDFLPAAFEDLSDVDLEKPVIPD